MFERFTNRAQEVIGEAKKAAAQLEQNYIGTEHLLLGLVRVSDSVASKLLQEQGVTEERLEELISSLINEYVYPKFLVAKYRFSPSLAVINSTLPFNPRVLINSLTSLVLFDFNSNESTTTNDLFLAI